MKGDPSEGVDKGIVEEVEQMRSMKITRRDVLKYGRTRKRPACNGADADGKSKRVYSHNEECRKRMQEKMKLDDEDKVRVEDHIQKIEWRMAERIERQDEAKRARKGEYCLLYTSPSPRD